MQINNFINNVIKIKWDVIIAKYNVKIFYHLN